MTRLILVLTALALSVASARGADALPSADWMKRTRRRVEQLLGPRRSLLAPPEAPPNPFAMPGQPKSEATDTASSPRESDQDTLARLAATLKINGLVEVAGVPQVIINQLSYKEGDLVAVREGDKATYLRVVNISPASVTLELNKIEQVVHLK